MERETHYFWAVRIPDSVKQTIHDELVQIKPVFQFKRWVDLNDYHITLAFLGSVNPQQLSPVISLVGDAIKKQKVFQLEIEGLNVFGPQKSPRIFWGAVNEVNQLFQLQEIVHKTCLAAGFSLETRRYHPHITLARKWGGIEDFKMGDLATHNPFGEKVLSFQVSEIVLYKSNLENTPKYESIAAFSLVEG
ncbi:RNA 2',3'-cyclic phosphodiesterase [Lysinibacillus sp. 2017]|uniref:RNA 2',3'-cyclic phosphodiesterase n=1 Tax=unclassified Lysinibacillus TaxID=2636778 RepID=UPI000D52856E|nr:MULTISPECIES: RNA 2',3'-cyclic phosphodiesterase [unclassified Lysinibacillus]AWE06929.1 RNA 2',3'-cyclic phosphodiesterase [Lysinibacillus sp. 2017]TGN37144.1 RNA 2',3'-cyclic phosphodiesterase [Lysinibacillus sp. S2017]